MTTEKTEKSDKTPTPPTPPVQPRGIPQVDPARLAGLEQVREILFGAIHRDLEQRMARADTHVAARIHELEQESRRRVEVLEEHFKRETETLAARVERQLVELNDGLRTLTREQREATGQAERKLSKTEDANAAGLRELRHQLHEQAKAFLDELQGLRKEMLATLQRELGLEAGERVEDRDEVRSGVTH